MVAEVVEEQTMNPVLGGSNRPSDTPKKPYKIGIFTILGRLRAGLFYVAYVADFFLIISMAAIE
jgi:hypothetical protein